jgi:lon-related putative ATP-dependent protease
MAERAEPSLRLPPEALCRRADPAHLPFVTTDDLGAPDGPVGQERAVEALDLGMAIRSPGYNVYALGPPGIGRHLVVRRMLEARAATEPVPSDWCYVHRFAEPHRPRALRLPPGRGVLLRDDLARFVERLRVLLPAAFESEDYRQRLQALEKQHAARREAAFGELKDVAGARSLALVRTPLGWGLAPLRNGEVVDPEAFERLPEADRTRVQADIDELQQALRRVIEKLPAWQHEHHERVRELNHSVARGVVEALGQELRARYTDLADVLEHLDAVERDVVANVHDFLGENGGEERVPDVLRRLLTSKPTFGRYAVNLVVRHDGEPGAPVVYEDRPSHPRLVGRVEHHAQLGMWMTDFSHIKPGALHRANGGYLILDARRLLAQPYAWDELKRALRSREIAIESVGEMLGLVSTTTLDPQPIPLDVKVVLVGDRLVYYLLSELDPDFLEAFKVAADFEEDLPRDGEGEARFARLVAQIAREEKLRPLSRDATARVVEWGSRLAGDARRITARVRNLTDLMREADHGAAAAGRTVVQPADVEAAMAAGERRAGRVAERIREQIRRGTLLIETKGSRVGQVNGLSVVRLGEHHFGFPARVTARVRPGRGEIVDIERETELGGPIHSKGVLILSGYLGGHYAPDRPLALAASLVFEQSYGPVEGDSASAAELLALISALGRVPLSQSLAVTGSVDQHGVVQPVGGVNEKIEGFFDACAIGGLTGDQGVLLPAANAEHLMLRKDVVEAAAAGRFHVYTFATIDEGLARLTGLVAGVRQKDGRFPEASVNARVEARLAEFAKAARSVQKKER